MTKQANLFCSHNVTALLQLLRNIPREVFVAFWTCDNIKYRSVEFKRIREHFSSPLSRKVSRQLLLYFCGYSLCPLTCLARVIFVINIFMRFK
jgi:hypothetical protein